MDHSKARQWHCLQQGAAVADGTLGSWEKDRAQQQHFLHLRKRQALQQPVQLTGTSVRRWFLVIPTLPTLNILNATIKSICPNERNHVNVPGRLTRQNSSAAAAELTHSEADLTLAVQPSQFSKFSASEELVKFRFV